MIHWQSNFAFSDILSRTLTAALFTRGSPKKDVGDLITDILILLFVQIPSFLFSFLTSHSLSVKMPPMHHVRCMALHRRVQGFLSP